MDKDASGANVGIGEGTLRFYASDSNATTGNPLTAALSSRDFRLYVAPKNIARLNIASGHITVEVPIDEYPNAWVRFWYRALLGWTWERIAPDESP